ncbi:MAG: DUF971 domain-containing protein [Candidatus Tectomicrobia bacterium]|nr:DUF971 domain-containing protein [Candidatus Tectomicrobia bacterium]
MATSGPYPVEIQRNDGGVMRILWNDGHECRYPYAKLRQACPCATCRDEQTHVQRDPFHIVIDAPTDAVEPAMLSTVGHYALNIEWSDGHRTGIYPWSLLRDLCD